MAEEDIDINARLHDAVSGPAKRAEGALEDLDTQLIQTAASMEAMESSTDSAGDELDQLTRAINRNTRAQEQQARAAKQNRDEMGRFTKDTKRGKFELKSFLKVGLNFGKFFKVAKIFAIADGINFLATGIAGLGAAGFAAVAGLAPLTGLLVAYPGLIAAGGQGLVAFKMGVKGVGEAIKVLADPKASPEALAEALKNLTPEARKFAVEVADLRKQSKALQQNLQQKFFKGLSKEVAPLAKIFFPLLNRTLGATATGLNNVAKYGIKFLKLKSTVKALNTVMGSNASIVQNLGMSGVNILGALLHTLVAAAPMLREMSSDLRDFTATLAGTASMKGGGLTKFFSNSYALAKRVTAVLVDIFMGIYNIGKLALPLAGSMGEATETIATNFRKWTESEGGRKKIQEFFAFMKPVIWEISKTVWALVQAFGAISMSPNFVATMASFRTVILPAIVAFIQASDGQFIPSIMRIIESLLQLAGSLNIIGPISTIIRVLADALGWLSTQVAGMSEGQRQLLGWVITFGLFFKVVGPSLQVIKNFLPAGFTFSKVLSLIGKGLLFVGRALLALVIANPVVAVIVLIIGLLVLMYFKFDWFRNFVNAVWRGIAQVAIAVWNWIKQAAQQFWSWIGPTVMAVVGVIIAYFKLVWAWWKFLWAVAKLIITAALVVIVGYVKTYIAIIGAVIRFILAWWKAVWNAIKPVVMVIMKAVADEVKSKIELIKTIIEKIKPAFSTVFNAVKSIVMPIIDAIKGGIEGITGVIDKVTGGINSLQQKVSSGLPGIPFLASGGDLGAGTTAVVGERGPEAFVSRGGNVKVIGAQGPEFFKPDSSGYVVPNHALTGDASGSSGVPSWATNALRRSATAQMPEAAPSKAHKPARGTDTMVEEAPTVIFKDNHFDSDVDVKKAVKEAWREYKLERERQ